MIKEILFFRNGERIMRIQCPDQYDDNYEILSSMQILDGSDLDRSAKARHDSLLYWHEAALVNSIVSLEVGDEVWFDDEFVFVIDHLILLIMRSVEIKNDIMNMSDLRSSADFFMPKLDEDEFFNAVCRDFIAMLKTLDYSSQKEKLLQLPRDLLAYVFSCKHDSDSVSQKEFEALKKEMLVLH